MDSQPQTTSTVEVFFNDGQSLVLPALAISGSTIVFDVAVFQRIDHAKGIRFWDGSTTVEATIVHHQELSGTHGIVLVEISAQQHTTAEHRRSSEVDVALAEANHVWDRFNTLEERNRTNQVTLFRLFCVLIAFASAPFTFEHFSKTGLSRVWGVCGLWVSFTAWIYTDRTFRSYGRHLFERVFCLCQLKQYRRLLLGRWPAYNSYSLFSDQNLQKDKSLSAYPERVERSQVLATLYFYKIVSAFFPFYTVLFLALILSPLLMLDPMNLSTRASYARFALGFSAIVFVWLFTSTRRCMGLLMSAFCARRISRSRPWPTFPTNERLQLFRGRSVLNLALLVTSIVISTCNLARLVFLLLAHPDGTEWWVRCDWYLLAVTSSWIVVVFVHSEIDVRYVMGKAHDMDRAPAGHEK